MLPDGERNSPPATVCMGTRVVLPVAVGAAVVGGAELVSAGVGVDVSDVEGPGEAGLVAVSADEEVAVLPHPAASMAASTSAATFREVTASQLGATRLGAAARCGNGIAAG
jgi:hypothetical protein